MKHLDWSRDKEGAKIEPLLPFALLQSLANPKPTAPGQPAQFG
jgi:hypothetical protein